MSQHTNQSSYREKLLEHLFVAELLKFSWLSASCEVEVSRPEVDRAGYDLLIEANGIIRHVQLKTSHHGASTFEQDVQLSLMSKPSGCIVWLYFNQESLQLGPFLFFGGTAGQPLPDVSAFKVSKHVRGNKDGVKPERPNVRKVSKRQFQKFQTIEELYHVLFSGHT